MSFTHTELQEMPWNTFIEKEYLYDGLFKEDKIKYLESWVGNKESRKNNYFYKEELKKLK